MVGAFFVISIWLIIIAIKSMLNSWISHKEGTVMVACFKLKTEHENLHRNKANNVILYPATDQQLRGMVSECFVWW
jgi:hypothetical protein